MPLLTNVHRAMLLRLFDDTSDVADSTNRNSHVFRDSMIKDSHMAEAESVEEAVDAPSPDAE